MLQTQIMAIIMPPIIMGEMNLAAVLEALPVNKVQNLNMHITR